MRTTAVWRIASLAAVALAWIGPVGAGDAGERQRVERIIGEAIRPVMTEHDVPGMAVGVIVQGRRYVVNYGVASRESGQKVTDETIFELGSVSKTLTATLASYAQVIGALSFSDTASKHLPALAGCSFDRISLLDLATYTAGGLPLQFPDDVTDRETMIAYYRHWRPAYAPATQRLYSNVSIGLFGHLAAASLGKPFGEAMERTLFPALGLTRTYVTVPPARMGDYAYGYAKDAKPVRVTPGVLDVETYGVKTTATDMLRFVEANIDGAGLDETMRRAIRATHTGYFRIGDMVQGLGWEMYAYPTSQEALLTGNSTRMILEANPATKLDPPLPPQDAALIDKTGSTNGFGAYVAAVPSRGIGIVMLANRNYPIPARVKAAYRILSALDGRLGPAPAQ